MSLPIYSKDWPVVASMTDGTLGGWRRGDRKKKQPTVGWINGRDTPVKKLVADV